MSVGIKAASAAQEVTVILATYEVEGESPRHATRGYARSADAHSRKLHERPFIMRVHEDGLNWRRGLADGMQGSTKFFERQILMSLCFKYHVADPFEEFSKGRIP